MIGTYTLTTLIVAAWAIRIILEKKIIFRRTILDIPLVVYLATSLISTIFSIDPRTSWLGYYSRFNGGMLSLMSYSLLYWAFVSNMDRKNTLKLIVYSLLPGTFLVSVYGVFQHFGIDKNIWVQDVQNRVFSTLGQPNWLAAFLVALIPLTWTGLVKKSYSYVLPASPAKLCLSALFFITLLFTKSRSGLLGFIAADIIFWGFTLWQDRKEALKPFLIHNLLFVFLVLAIGNPFQSSSFPSPEVNSAPALETGGTESGTIRKIVWKGAIEIWKHYPLFGTGPETFAYAYYQFRPVEHNLVSEWDFIYNKAHNEYLNLAANTGSAGLLSYLILIFFSVVQISKSKQPALLSGYASLLVTNFFGFSVVPTQLLLFLFPAIALTLND